MKYSISKIFAGSFFCLCLISSQLIFAQQKFPAPIIPVMVPYPAGGTSDSIARIFSPVISKNLGTQVIVENLGGVSGAIGAQKVLSAPADGNYIFQGSPNEVILAPLANAAVKFNAEDFELVQLIGYAPMVIVARKDLPANSMDELITLARNSKEKPISYGSVGIGSMYHILGEHLGQVIDAKMTHVPYKGGAPLLQDLAGGQLDFTIFPHFAGIDGLVAQGRIKILGVIASKRFDHMKDVPTVNEGKLLKNFVYSIWTGYMVKKGTPLAIKEKIKDAVQKSMQDQDVVSKIAGQNQLLAKPMTLKESQIFYTEEIAQYRKLAKSIGLEKQ